jgi:hypothetical protein
MDLDGAAPAATTERGRGARTRLEAAAATLLDHLDPSLLAPGAAALLALLFPWLYEGRVSPPQSVARLLAFGGVAWVIGLVAVVVGRQLRLLVARRLRPRGARHDRVVRALQGHGVDARLGAAPADDLSSYPSAGRLVERLEAAVRREPALWAAARELERLAQRSAACDGLALAALMGACVLAYVPTQVARWPVGPSTSLVLAALAGAVALALWGEAHRLEKRRLDVLVATAVERPAPAGEPAEGAGVAATAAADAAA